MRTAVLSSMKKGMATVVYGAGNGEASNPMPVLDNPANQTLGPGDRVVVAPLNGMKDGIVLGKYWNKKNQPEEG